MANDFTDPRCKALWRFENGALTADSKGTNTLVESASPPTADLAIFQEGAASAAFAAASSQDYHVVDANLDSGFPFKGGSYNTIGTFCFWIYFANATLAPRIICKFQDGTTYLMVDTYLSFLRFVMYSSYGAEFWNTAPLLSGRWYHVALRLDGGNKIASMRVYDAVALTTTNYAHTLLGTFGVNTGDFYIGSSAHTGDYFGGNTDEFPVFNVLLTDAEIDKIRAGTYGVFEYAPAGIPLTLTPESACVGPGGFTYAPAGIPLTLTPESACELGAIYTGEYAGHILLRLTPIAATELFDPGAVIAIPATTGGFVMGGAGIWVSSIPTDTRIPTTPVDSQTGFLLGGEGNPVSTVPQVDAIALEEVPFLFCGPGVSGNAATSDPSLDALVPEGGFVIGGAGVWGQVAPADLPSTVLVPTGGYVLGGSGFSLDPAVTPTDTVLVGTGGWKMGGRRPDPVEVTYPGLVDRTIAEPAGFEMGGEGVLVCTYPESTVIASLGAFLALGGAGLCTSKMPPSMLIVTGEGGYVLAGAEPAEVYEAWVLSGQAFEPSVFSAFNFNSFAVHREQAYACGDAGIYLLGADHDAGETIHTGARVGPVNLGSDRDKRLRGIQYGQGGKNTRVRVQSENGDVGVFAPERDENRVVVSRNIQGRDFTIDFMDFEELSHVEIFPLRLARR